MVAREATILVVDDEPAMARSVQRILERDYRVHSTTSPRQALELARQHRPRLAIVDIRMGEMDGFELMERLKSQDPHLQVILMTGSTYGADEKLIRAIRGDAFYYIHKPFDRGVLRTLVRRCLQLCALEEANRSHLAHLESQLQEAKVFQQTMLPQPSACLEGVEIRAAYRPCVELAGDLYDYAAAGPGQVALLIADVVGHGASAAMLTAVIKSAFHASQAQGYDPLAVVDRAAESLAAFELGRFVTVLAVRLDAAAGRLEYVNAGHEGGLLSPAGESPHALDPTGPLISPALRGLGLSWQRQTLPWTAESLLLLYTDGITEARRDEEEFGPRRLAELATGGAPGAGLLENVLTAVERFVPGPASDDRTLLAAF